MATREAPAENRQKLMESLVGGAVCEKIPPSKLISQYNVRSSCMSLFGESCLKCSKNVSMLSFYSCYYSNDLHEINVPKQKLITTSSLQCW